MDDIFNTQWEKSYRLELKVAEIIRQQEIDGWLLDVPLVRQHIETLESQVEEIDAEINPHIPQLKRVPLNAHVAEPFRQDGEPTRRVINWLGCPAAGPFTKIFWEPINLGSIEQIKEFLLREGWKPTQWNFDKKTGEKTSPKLTEDSYGSIKSGIGALIAKRMVIQHRLGQLNGWLRDVREDGRIEARANTVGTPTARMRHSIVVNVPKPKPHVFFGKEMRSCFIAKPGYSLVGCDAVGLENRWIAHYLGDPKVNEIFTEGDFHHKFWKAIERFSETRDDAKNIEYAYFFGATDPKLGAMADYIPDGLTRADVGRLIRNSINNWVTGLDDLIRKVQRAANKGYLFGIDGRKLRVRSRHSSFNTLIQSSGAIMMKAALCFLDKWIKGEGLDAIFVGNFHDEFQMEVLDAHVERVMELSVKAVVKAGELFNVRCPMMGEAKAGKNWSETH